MQDIAAAEVTGWSRFYSRLGFPLRNPRWSWGSHADLAVLLTTWEDQRDASGRFVQVFWPRLRVQPSHGLRERLDHLRTLWSGGLAGYAVVARAQDPASRPRRILSYDADAVRPIVTLVARGDGEIWAELSDAVPVEHLKKHAVRHRLIPGNGEFPVARPKRRPAATGEAGYLAQLPAMREWLIAVARRGGVVTYAEARAPFKLKTFEHRHAMDRVGHECVDRGEPVLTALIVDAATGRCSAGFDKEFRRDDAAERDDCYAFWATTAGERAASGSVQPGAAPLDSLRERAARFASVELRPEQARFRRLVFMEHTGACVVTGCTVEAALDAAHRQGREWRRGHNSGADGLLLRKDVHALYDAGLLCIHADGTVTLDASVEAHYRHYLPGLRR